MPLGPADLLGADGKVLAPLRVEIHRWQVAHPQLERIHAQLVGELVHHHFGDEARLRMSGRAHRALRPGIDVDVLVPLTPVGKDVDRIGHREPRALSGTPGAPALGVEGEELALCIHAGANLCIG
jgi:hypothetical protein